MFDCKFTSSRPERIRGSKGFVVKNPAEIQIILTCLLAFSLKCLSPDQEGLSKDTLYTRPVIAFFSLCSVGEGIMEHTKLRFPELGHAVFPIR